MRATRLRSSSSNSSTGRACILSAASGYWRICASAIRRRASRSGSSGSSMTSPSMGSSCSAMQWAHYPAMDPREAKAIMSEGAIRPETPRDREERRVLAEELAVSPVKGAPLPQRVRNFRPDADAAIRALGGPAHWMRRLRAIEDQVSSHEAQLDEAWRALAVEARDPATFAREWMATARDWSFAEVNDLIDRHN